jgi:hypothetical protein
MSSRFYSAFELPRIQQCVLLLLVWQLILGTCFLGQAKAPYSLPETIFHSHSSALTGAGNLALHHPCCFDAERSQSEESHQDQMQDHESCLASCPLLPNSFQLSLPPFSHSEGTASLNRFWESHDISPLTPPPESYLS